ncbi:MAG TPA: BT_3928 family protein [Bacteroidales bacterium]|nr:BT_3928 family protein [Bacteroidales bacterium]
MKLLRIISSLFVGSVFVFSGFVKAVDPLGTAYKFGDYFEAFHLDFLNPLSLILAVLLCTFELVIGLNLLLGIRMKITSWLLIIFMSGFTIITLRLAISNPVTDCGCFGDAVILTNWQTFWKNVILFVPTVFIFLQRSRFPALYKIHTDWLLTVVFFLFGIILAIYSYYHLPLLDFRPYRTGVNIPEKMIIPEGSPVDEYQFNFIYSKEGIQKEFMIENLPDSTWQWVETRQKLIRKGYVPPLHDFSITTLDGDEITQEVLSDPGYSFLIIAYDLNKTDKKAFRQLNRLSEEMDSADCRFYCLTSSTYEVINEFISQVKPDFQIYTADNITLKTIIRSNPGLLLIKDGTIMGKWHSRNIPDKIEGNLMSYSIGKLRMEKSRLIVYSFIASFLLFFLLFHFYTIRFCRRINED